MELYIFGAQGYALGAYEAIKTLCPGREIPCFLVSQMGNNAPVLGGIPVKELASFAEGMSAEEKKSKSILIATPENVQDEIAESLEQAGFRNYIRMDTDRWTELIKLFHCRVGRFLPLQALPVGCRKPELQVYMARCHKDRPLKTAVSLPEYMIPIQVGAANCDERVAELTDDTGENISPRNVNYSEMTGLYWAWKNRLLSAGASDPDEGTYYGLAQYRRMFDLSEDDLLRIADNDVDVVLPYPLPYEPSIHAHHERYLKEEDWDALLTALRELQPEYADAFPAILEQRYLFNYNVILAKKTVLRQYCEWLFPVLERTEELSVPKGSERADRYIGYMAESLETLYFMKNADKLNIVHTTCRMLV
ncbi:MAG: DUF4422 domain-containing protein [Lachnospiraceae bacterium]|nr:DUF4422 domain-containing protein [Lachnospiraceae bacterium]